MILMQALVIGLSVLLPGMAEIMSAWYSPVVYAAINQPLQEVLFN